MWNRDTVSLSRESLIIVEYLRLNHPLIEHWSCEVNQPDVKMDHAIECVSLANLPLLSSHLDHHRGNCPILVAHTWYVGFLYVEAGYL